MPSPSLIKQAHCEVFLPWPAHKLCRTKTTVSSPVGVAEDYAFGCTHACGRHAYPQATCGTEMTGTRSTNQRIVFVLCNFGELPS